MAAHCTLCLCVTKPVAWHKVAYRKSNTEMGIIRSEERRVGKEC